MTYAYKMKTIKKEAPNLYTTYKIFSFENPILKQAI